MIISEKLEEPTLLSKLFEYFKTESEKNDRLNLFTDDSDENRHYLNNICLMLEGSYHYLLERDGNVSPNTFRTWLRTCCLTNEMLKNTALTADLATVMAAKLYVETGKHSGFDTLKNIRYMDQADAGFMPNLIGAVLDVGDLSQLLTIIEENACQKAK